MIDVLGDRIVVPADDDHLTAVAHAGNDRDDVVLVLFAPMMEIDTIDARRFETGLDKVRGGLTAVLCGVTRPKVLQADDGGIDCPGRNQADEVFDDRIGVAGRLARGLFAGNGDTRIEGTRRGSRVLDGDNRTADGLRCKTLGERK